MLSFFCCLDYSLYVKKPFSCILPHIESRLPHIFDSGHAHAFYIHFRKPRRSLHTIGKFALRMGCRTAWILLQRHIYPHIHGPNGYSLPSWLDFLHENMHHNRCYKPPYTPGKLGYILCTIGCSSNHPSFLVLTLLFFPGND